MEVGRMYSIAFMYKDGSSQTIAVKNEAEAQREMRDRIMNNPGCRANLIISEFDQFDPNRRWVKMERYENRNGFILKVDY